jgi:hypothetical protein
MHSEFRIELSGTSHRMTQWHNCDETTELDCSSGTGRIEISMQCAACNPRAPSSRLFGDIDYFGKIIIDVGARSIEIDGMIDQFPAFEAYATINDGAGFALFQIPPPFGNTVMNLPRTANRPVKFRAQDRDQDGVFEIVTKL